MLKILAVTVALSLSSCPGAIGKALRLWGYTEVRPATLLVEPGTLVEVQNRQPFKVHTLCTAKQMLGDDFVPQESLTYNADLSRINKRGVQLAVDVANVVDSNNVLSDMTDLKMNLDNAHIFEVTDHDIYSRRNKTSPYCLQLLRDRVKDGYKVTMIASAIRADVVYTLNWDRNSQMSVSAKIQALSNLSASLGANSAPQSANKISGKGLYWGIRDDVWLAYRYLEPGTAAPVEQDSRLIPTNLVVSGLKAAEPPSNPAPQTPQPAPSPSPSAPSSQPGQPSQPSAPATTPEPVYPPTNSHGHGRPAGLPATQDTGGGRKIMSVQTDEGEVTYEVDDEAPIDEFELTPADPEENWDGVVLEPVHEG